MKKVGLGLMILGLIGILFSAKPYFSQQRIDEVATYSGEYIQEVVIDSSYAKVEVLPTDHEEIIVELKGYARDKIQDTIDNVVSINEQIGQLAIDISRSRFFNFSLFSFNPNKRLDVIVWLPKKEYKHLKVKNDVGKTTVQNLAVEQLTIENAVANMNIENIIAKAIHVENNVGNITLNNNSGEIFATNDVGNISVRTNEINHHMTFVAKVGKISLVVPIIPEDTNFKATTSLGNVRIFGESDSYFNNDAKFILSMTTDVGNITVQASE